MQYILLTAIVLLLTAYLLLRQGARQQEATGLPVGELVYSDTSTWQPLERPLLSRRYGLVGKPDYIVAGTDRHHKGVIPVEVKSGKCPQTPPAGHILQLGAYCLLIAEHYGATPAYGLLHYNDATVQIPFTAELQAEVIRVAEALRQAEGVRNLPRDHTVAARCRACGYRHACGEEALT